MVAPPIYVRFTSRKVKQVRKSVPLPGGADGEKINYMTSEISILFDFLPLSYP